MFFLPFWRLAPISRLISMVRHGVAAPAVAGVTYAHWPAVLNTIGRIVPIDAATPYVSPGVIASVVAFTTWSIHMVDGMGIPRSHMRRRRASRQVREPAET
jgi:hypothetical protein